MARTEARISVDIWDDPDFLALNSDEQRIYLFALSQRDLEHTGVLPLRERRWARAARGLTAAGVTDALNGLERARFVVVDVDYEELLIRAFLRRDKVYKQPNVLRSAASNLATVASPRIRVAIAEEIRRILGQADVSEGSAKILTEMLGELGNPSANPSENPSSNPLGDVKGSPNPSGNPSDTPASTPTTADAPRGRSDVSPAPEGSPNPSGNPSPDPTRGTPGERGMDTAVTNGFPSPQPLFPEPQKTPARGRVAKRDDLPEGFAEFWDVYPLKKDPDDAIKAWNRAVKKTAPEALIAAALAYRDHDPQVKSGYPKYPATWLNKGSWANDNTTPTYQATPAPNGYRPFTNPEDDSAYFGDL
jgi:hypothetical protein